MTATVSAAARLDAEAFPDGLSVGSPARSPNQGRNLDFERHIRQYRADLYRFAFWLTRDHSVAEDALQESLIRAWRSWDVLRDKSAVKQWLLTIVRRECMRMYTRSPYQMVDVDELAPRDEHAIAVEENTSLHDVHRAILSLDTSYREPLILQVLMGYSAEEISAIIGITPGAVLTRLFRARQKLAEDLVPESTRGSKASGPARSAARCPATNGLTMRSAMP